MHIPPPGWYFSFPFKRGWFPRAAGFGLGQVLTIDEQVGTVHVGIYALDKEPYEPLIGHLPVDAAQLEKDIEEWGEEVPRPENWLAAVQQWRSLADEPFAFRISSSLPEVIRLVEETVEAELTTERRLRSAYPVRGEDGRISVVRAIIDGYEAPSSKVP